MGTVREQQEATLVGADGVEVSVVHLPALDARDDGRCVVLVHGFTNNWRIPRVQRVIGALRRHASVVAVDMRGHGRSGGLTTLGDTEVMDVTEAVRWARQLGYAEVATVGFSMGGSVVIRQAALGDARPDAVVSVSAPAFWYYKGTRVMRLLHHVVEHPVGRALMRVRGVRITDEAWVEPLPVSPVEAMARLSDIPVLIVHGTVDHYFPTEHPKALFRAVQAAGNDDAQLWLIDGFAHAESGIDDATLESIGGWLDERLVSV